MKLIELMIVCVILLLFADFFLEIGTKIQSFQKESLHLLEKTQLVLQEAIHEP